MPKRIVRLIEADKHPIGDTWILYRYEPNERLWYVHSTDPARDGYMKDDRFSISEEWLENAIAAGIWALVNDPIEDLIDAVG